MSEKFDKCNQCDNLSSSHLKTENTQSRIFRQNAMSVNIYILSGEQFEITFVNTQWRKSKQKQPAWLVTTGYTSSQANSLRGQMLTQSEGKQYG